jgi:dTMP kinase
VLEGVDGSGKTTQLQALADWLPTSGLMPPGAELITTRASGGTSLGACLRGLLLHPPGDTEPCRTAELLLYVADTAQLCSQVVEPALAAGHWVLCDRFTASTVAYQGYGRGHDLEVIRQLNMLAAESLEPDLTLWLDLSPADALQRRGNRPADRIERAGEEFLGRVAFGYDNLYNAAFLSIPVANKSPAVVVESVNWRYVSANAPLAQVTKSCQLKLRARFRADATP